MNAREFEQRFLELVFRTNLRLSPHVVAYRLGIPFAEAKAHLDRMAKEGVVSLEINEDGSLRYEVPGAERPSRDLMAEGARPEPKSPPPPRPAPGFGQYFAGPAASPPEPPPVSRVYLSAPPPRSLSWMWIPLLAMGGLFLFPLLLTMVFVFFRDLFGLGFFFLMGFFVVKALRGGCRPHSYRGRAPHHHCRSDRDYPF